MGCDGTIEGTEAFVLMLYCHIPHPEVLVHVLTGYKGFGGMRRTNVVLGRWFKYSGCSVYAATSWNFSQKYEVLIYSCRLVIQQLPMQNRNRYCSPCLLSAGYKGMMRMNLKCYPAKTTVLTQEAKMAQKEIDRNAGKVIRNALNQWIILLDEYKNWQT